MSDEDSKQSGKTLLTQDEAVTLLALDRVGLKDPRNTLRYLRASRQLGFLKVAGKVMFRPSHIEEYLERHEVEARGD